MRGGGGQVSSLHPTWNNRKYRQRSLCLGNISLRLRMSSSHTNQANTLSLSCSLTGKKCLKNEIDFIHLGFYTPLHNHHPANSSLREVITLMKIKYSLKFTFIFIYLLQVRIKPELGGSLEWSLLPNESSAPEAFLPYHFHPPQNLIHQCLPTATSNLGASAVLLMHLLYNDHPSM